MTWYYNVSPKKGWRNILHSELQPSSLRQICRLHALEMLGPSARDLTSTWSSGGFTSNQWPFQEPIDWRYLPYIRPIFQGYVREYLHKIWPDKWYSTSILGSWNSHWMVKHGETAGTLW